MTYPRILTRRTGAVVLSASLVTLAAAGDGQLDLLVQLFQQGKLAPRHSLRC